MRKSALTAAALAMSVSMAGIAYAAVPSGSTATDTSSVTSAVPAFSRAAVDDHGHGRHRADDPARHGADDPARHDVGEDRGRVHSRADDPIGHDRGDDSRRAGSPASVVIHTVPARTVTVPAASVARMSDDPAGHDATDDRDSAHRHGADDRSGHDAGDDHGSDRHGSDRHGSDRHGSGRPGSHR
jgi:uncharacterized low-complexity protein